MGRQSNAILDFFFLGYIGYKNLEFILLQILSFKWTSSKIFMNPSFVTSRHDWKEAPVNPSEPGLLPMLTVQIVLLFSCSSDNLSNCFSWATLMGCQLMPFIRGLKTSYSVYSFWQKQAISHPITSLSRWPLPLLILPIWSHSSAFTHLLSYNTT